MNFFISLEAKKDLPQVDKQTVDTYVGAATGLEKQLDELLKIQNEELHGISQNINSVTSRYKIITSKCVSIEKMAKVAYNYLVKHLKIQKNHPDHGKDVTTITNLLEKLKKTQKISKSLNKLFKKVDEDITENKKIGKFIKKGGESKQTE